MGFGSTFKIRKMLNWRNFRAINSLSTHERARNQPYTQQVAVITPGAATSQWTMRHTATGWILKDMTAHTWISCARKRTERSDKFSCVTPAPTSAAHVQHVTDWRNPPPLCNYVPVQIWSCLYNTVGHAHSCSFTATVWKSDFCYYND